MLSKKLKCNVLSRDITVNPLCSNCWCWELNRLLDCCHPDLQLLHDSSLMLCVLGFFPWDNLKNPSFQMKGAAVLGASFSFMDLLSFLHCSFSYKQKKKKKMAVITALFTFQFFCLFFFFFWCLDQCLLFLVSVTLCHAHLWGLAQNGFLFHL